MPANLTIKLVAALLASEVLAQTPTTDHAAHHSDAAAKASAAPLSDGEVRKIDKSAGKVTIKHGQLPNLEMPPMTMVFRVKDPAMLDKIREGDKIKFSADKINGVFTVTEIQTAR